MVQGRESQARPMGFVVASEAASLIQILWSFDSVEFLIGGNKQELGLCPCDFSRHLNRSSALGVGVQAGRLGRARDSRASLTPRCLRLMPELEALRQTRT